MQELKSSNGGSFICYETCALKLLKYKTDGDCMHSMNAPALVLADPLGDKPLVLSFR
jgi:hypothetical protein